MAAQSILGRITQMARANINAILDQVEDPQVMLDQMTRDYTSSITEAENAVAQTVGNLRMPGGRRVGQVPGVGRKALAASSADHCVPNQPRRPTISTPRAGRRASSSRSRRTENYAPTIADRPRSPRS